LRVGMWMVVEDRGATHGNGDGGGADKRAFSTQRVLREGKTRNRKPRACAH
jgi:hypothetical protein